MPVIIYELRSMTHTFSKRLLQVLVLTLPLMLLISPVARAAPQEEIRVLLYSGTADVLEIYIDNGDYELFDERGGHVIELSHGSNVEIETSRNGYDVYYRGKRVANGLSEVVFEALDNNGLFKYEDKLYRGNLRVVANGSTSYIINTLDLEYYLYGVVGREIGYNQPLEAAKAQAVASRSFAMAKLNQHNKYYDIGSDASTQTYGGYTAEIYASSGNIIRAVDATKGEIICYRGSPFEGYYHSNAGGHTEDLANVWGGGAPLKGVPSPYDSYVEKSGYSSSIYQWQIPYTTAELRDLAERYSGKSIGEYRSIEISTLDERGNPSASGRVLQATITGSLGEVTVRRDAVRSLLGNLKSNLFTLDGIVTVSSLYVLDKGQKTPVLVEDVSNLYIRVSNSLVAKVAELGGSLVIMGARQSAIWGGSSKSTGNITICGKGYGHGAGMSQWGAIGMAADGYRYKDILAHYFNMDTNNDFTLEKYY